MSKADISREFHAKRRKGESDRSLAERMAKTRPKIYPTPENARDSLRFVLGKKGAALKKRLGDKVLPTDAQGLEQKIKAHLKTKKKVTIEQLSDFTDVGISKIKAAIENLSKAGHTISIDKGSIMDNRDSLPKSAATFLDVEKNTVGLYKFGVTGDNHMGSRYERMDVLNALYDEFERQGIKQVFNTGNWIDGEARFNTHDLHTRGMDGQIDYFVEKYPSRPGIITSYVTGDDHEGWYTQREGVNVGAYAQMKARESGRTDLVFLGHMEADVILKAPKGQTMLRVLHPGGGSSYAISYTSQKIVESYTGAEKPDILFDGHYHKAGYNYIRGVHVVQTGCTQDQTPFMRKKRLAAHLGGWIVEFGTDSNGAVTRFKQEFLPFFDNGYYEKKWAYKWK